MRWYYFANFQELESVFISRIIFSSAARNKQNVRRIHELKRDYIFCEIIRKQDFTMPNVCKSRTLRIRKFSRNQILFWEYFGNNILCDVNTPIDYVEHFVKHSKFPQILKCLRQKLCTNLHFKSAYKKRIRKLNGSYFVPGGAKVW